MTRGYVDALIALAAALILWLGVARWRDALPDRAVRAVVVGPAPDARVDAGSPVADDARVAIERNPFRLSRLPADVRFARASAPAVEPVQTPLVRPPLSLTGIVGGPPWTAIIEGLPGQAAGTLVREGSTFDKLVVRTVTASNVVVQGPDTTWRLTLPAGRQR